jgi:hypothetical protein
MFETSQEEPSTGMAKHIGIVLAIVAVLLVVVYFAFLRGATSTTSTKTAATAAAGSEKADPMRDLSIVKFNLHRDQTQTMAMWDIDVANRSRSIAYKDIQYVTNYYNAQDTLVYRNQGTLSDIVQPADQHAFDNINDGLYPVGTARYTIEIKGAQAAQ